MAFNTESAFAERNIQRASHYLLQKRKIAQSLTRSIQTLKAKNTHHMSHASLSQFFNFQDFLTYLRVRLIENVYGVRRNWFSCQ